VEEQDAIFMPAGNAARTSPPSAAASEQASIVRQVQFDTTMLFRYSAITFNAHRIHYDFPYATMKEGYPALVVSGGLSALVLLDFARSQMDRPIESVSTRNVGLLHIGDEVVLKGRQSEDQWLMWAETTAGRRAVEMTIR
jgi:3-methylfumaryl-CoA hydratase